ncbi:hypothetical protein AKJ45_00290 [candidate division MSBL1 archaeon SCGC-AAA261F19]|uniref:4Fe4S-binding SPASM domain-containing protein n=1 Tax=candidate division MSBL1 archaeon SCGC-AAA261F19 TaxID=1698275 RepID=A0A133VBQ3_9EURY|nr:hypothetical protein AKJ45_00290 [candidate division MSBL1 archaeon SCGC-AAA261F19]
MFWGDLKVLWNGDVTPCCRDYDAKCVLGNIQNKNLLDMWRGEQMNCLRYLHLQGRQDEIDLCRDCRPTSDRKYTYTSRWQAFAFLVRFLPRKILFSGFFNKFWNSLFKKYLFVD